MIKVHFSDFFGVEEGLLASYGAFNVSLVNDLPLFIDPFLLFNSNKEEYRNLHDEMIRYLRFLREKSERGIIPDGLLRAWFTFPEVKQNWFGYSLVGNQGSGLGMDFAESLRQNLTELFSDFGEEQITRGSHLEKLCLVEAGVGRDSISDFTANLTKQFLLEYTQRFALEHIQPDLRARFPVPKVVFNYDTETWVTRTYELPAIDGDFVLLTPKDLLTKDEVWINRNDMVGNFHDVVVTIPNEQLRGQLNNYLFQILPEDAKKKEERKAIARTIARFPGFIEHFIRYKEDRGDEAVAVSDREVAATQRLFVDQLSQFVSSLALTDFYTTPGDTKEESLQRVLYLKDVIENKGGWRAFFLDGKPIRREVDLHIMFRLTWFGTPSDVSREVDDGRGPADFKVSRGRWDKTILEFKLAKNPKLKRNLQNQAAAYQSASDADKALKVILFFNDAELERVEKILAELGLTGHPDVILIDGRPKPSASNV